MIPKNAKIDQFFTKQPEKRMESTDPVVVDDEDDSFEVIFEKCTPGPSSSSGTPKASKLVNSVQKTPETPKNATKWGDQLQRSNLVSGESTTGRDWQTPFSVQIGKNRKSTNLKSDLLQNGFDETNSNFIFYPVDEPIRPFELNLIKCISASNCCIALPASAPSTPARICAISVANFLKWFPRCRVLLVSASDDWSSALEKLGLESQVTKIQTMTQFKKPKNGVGRVIFCTSPQCAVKVVESPEARDFLEEIRLVFIDIRSTECCTKYKPILNALTLKQTFFRCVVLTTSTSNTSRRTASITKRQLMITNLQLSDWIEQTETDFSFRSSNIPSGVEVKYWKCSQDSERQAEIIRKFQSFSEDLMEELAEKELVASKYIRKCIWMDWKHLKPNDTPEISEKLKIAEILITCYKFLVLDGIVAARNYVKQCAALPGVQKYTNEIMGIFGGFSEFPTKFQLLQTAIESFLKMDNHVRGLILCRDSDQATELLNFLEFSLPKTATCMRIVPTGQPTARNLYQISQISTVFQDKKTPKIVICPVRIPEFIGFSDQIPLSEITFIASISRDSIFNFRKFTGAHLLILNEQLEKLRREDGRLIVDDGKFAQKEAKNTKIGAVERYDFKFEASRLRLNPANLKLKFFQPMNPIGRLFSEEPEGVGPNKTNTESSSRDPVEVQPKPKVPKSAQRKKRPISVLPEPSEPEAKRSYEIEELDEDVTIWNPDVQVLNEVKPCKSVKKSKPQRGNFDWSLGIQKNRHEYVNEITSKKRLHRLDELLRNLDLQFGTKED